MAADEWWTVVELSLSISIIYCMEQQQQKERKPLSNEIEFNFHEM